ncbi:MAG: DUF2147 domain-containing protein, partial [Bradyrhizobium sp.]
MSSTGRAETIPADPSGTWLTENGQARIRLERCGSARDRICGFIVWMKDPLDPRGQPIRDSLNSDPEKRTRALLGHQLILGLKLSPEGRFDGVLRDAAPGLRRVRLALLARLPQPDALRVDLLDFCLERMMSAVEAPAVRMYCVKIAHAMCRTEPDLRRELRLCLEAL